VGKGFETFDALVAKTKPERMVGHLVKDAKNLSVDCNAFVARSAGFKTVDAYSYESDVTPRMNQIAKPFFFISSLDDPFFGPKVIPVD
jgi:predicted alpha/beta-fold hydrolase